MEAMREQERRLQQAFQIQRAVINYALGALDAIEWGLADDERSSARLAARTIRDNMERIDFAAIDAAALGGATANEAREQDEAREREPFGAAFLEAAMAAQDPDTHAWLAAAPEEARAYFYDRLGRQIRTAVRRNRTWLALEAGANEAAGA